MFWPRPQNKEVPWLGIEPTPQRGQRQILNLLSHQGTSDQSFQSLSFPCMSFPWKNHIYSYAALKQIFHPSFRPIHPNAYQILAFALLTKCVQNQTLPLVPKPTLTHTPQLRKWRLHLYHWPVQNPGVHPETPSLPPTLRARNLIHFTPCVTINKSMSYRRTIYQNHYSLCSRFNHVDEIVSS